MHDDLLQYFLTDLPRNFLCEHNWQQWGHR